jgi:hypothetical protein
MPQSIVNNTPACGTAPLTPRARAELAIMIDRRNAFSPDGLTRSAPNAARYREYVDAVLRRQTDPALTAGALMSKAERCLARARSLRAQGDAAGERAMLVLAEDYRDDAEERMHLDQLEALDRAEMIPALLARRLEGDFSLRDFETMPMVQLRGVYAKWVSPDGPAPEQARGILTGSHAESALDTPRDGEAAGRTGIMTGTRGTSVLDD